MKRFNLKDTATHYTVSRNRYGDFNLTLVGSILCLFRDISHLNRDVNYREEVKINGIFWFDTTSSVKKGDVIGFSGLLYLVENVINAKDLLLRDQVQFIKCEVSLYRAVS